MTKTIKAKAYRELTWEELQKCRAEIFQNYRKGTGLREVTDRLNITLEAARHIAFNLFNYTFMNHRPGMSLEERRKMEAERSLYRRLNSYQGVNAGFKVNWMKSSYSEVK